jgi:hypothetical protein
MARTQTPNSGQKKHENSDPDTSQPTKVKMSLRVFAQAIHLAKPMAKASAAVNASRSLAVKVNGDKAQVEIAPLPAYKTEGPSSVWVDTTVRVLGSLVLSAPFPLILTLSHGVSRSKRSPSPSSR